MNLRGKTRIYLMFDINSIFNLDIEYIQIVSEEDLKDIQNEIINDEEPQQEGNAPKEHDKKEKKTKKAKNKSINVNKKI